MPCRSGSPHGVFGGVKPLGDASRLVALCDVGAAAGLALCAKAMPMLIPPRARIRLIMVRLLSVYFRPLTILTPSGVRTQTSGHFACVFLTSVICLRYYP